MSDSEHINSFFREPLADLSRCGILTNSKGDVLIIHDYVFPEDIGWVEYNPEDGAILIVDEAGISQALGHQIRDQAKQNLLHAQEVYLARVVDKQVSEYSKVNLIIHDAFSDRDE